ncbi:MAG: hypothetical protein KKI09_16825 [Spirochaetes bacterium]|nr:hypothetical protein [Spirochaetota bacterium]MBU0957090.1 hypothetical protein [Spirochaetota bacterium]
MSTSNELSTAPVTPGRSGSAWRWYVLLIAGILAFASCSSDNQLEVLKREQLFSLTYGMFEDELNLFNLPGEAPPLKTRIAMRDGIFFLVNGNAGKVLSFSSFGDLLSMIYNPDRNPEPLILTKTDSFAPVNLASSQGRMAATYPFNEPGEVAVDSTRRMYIEDKVPQSSRQYDAASNSLLERIVVRFSATGQYIDYLGQEGIGGTPFPYIKRVQVTEADECVVVSQNRAGWLVHWFYTDGLLRFSVNLPREKTPLPEDGEDLIASLEDVLPMSDGSGLLLKIDYYQEIIDPETRSASGIRFVKTIVWKMNTADGSYIDSFDIIPFQSEYAKRNNQDPVLRSWDITGSAGTQLFFSSVDEDGATYYAVYDTSDRSVRRYALNIADDELNYMTFFLSRDKILCALLAAPHEIRIVWWRFEGHLAGAN